MVTVGRTNLGGEGDLRKKTTMADQGWATPFILFQVGAAGIYRKKVEGERMEERWGWESKQGKQGFLITKQLNWVRDLLFLVSGGSKQGEQGFLITQTVKLGKGSSLHLVSGGSKQGEQGFLITKQLNWVRDLLFTW
jgi:hypothetical protein